MKKIIILLLAVCSYESAFAQLGYRWDEQKIMNTFNRAEFIFEGRVINRKLYNPGPDLITWNIVEITNIFKGGEKLKPGTVNIVTIGGTKIDKDGKITMMDVSDVQGLGGSGVYFCFTDKRDLVTDTTTTNTFNLTMWGQIMYNKAKYFSAGGFDKWFKSREELYEFLSKYPGVTIPKEKKKK